MSSNQATQTAPASSPQLFGHPAGLFTLFFAEMWERFSYYGMRALLLFYMMKGFLGYRDPSAYGVYGAYTALVYMTPFFGGLIADKLLGPRRAVVLGGLLMAAGHLLMTVQNDFAFFTALALLICGNGFFKPNISTIVGSLYAEGSPKRDAGFTIFYMGINLGAAMSPLLCGYIGETYGWHLGFGLATIGMLTGICVFVMPVRITQIMIGAGALAAAIGLFVFKPDNLYSIAVNIFVGVALLIAAVVAWIALGRGGLPKEAGAPPDRARLKKPVFGFLPAEWAVYLGSLVAVPLFALLVNGFAPFTWNKKAWQLIPVSFIESFEKGSLVQVMLDEISKPAGLTMFVTGIGALVYLLIKSFQLTKIGRERMFVVLILTFFSMLFWAFFEQAGSSVNNFTDRNVNRVNTERTISASDVGQTIEIQPTQAQLGYHNGEQMFTLSTLDTLRKEHEPTFTIDWTVAPDNVGMGVAPRTGEVPASVFQAVNPVCILLFGLLLSALWGKLGKNEPSTPFKFALGMLQLGLGFGVFWYGAQTAGERGMVGVEWLLLGYLLHTTGELCLSPVGLSMVTKLSPPFLVSTVMGMWFLATAFSQYLAMIISQLTGIVGEGGGEEQVIPAPSETVNVYGDVFGQIAIAALAATALSFALVPLLKYWMHEGKHDTKKA